jgi:ribosomal protein S18 acetylase RimI-like enzyme
MQFYNNENKTTLQLSNEFIIIKKKCKILSNSERQQINYIYRDAFNDNSLMIKSTGIIYFIKIKNVITTFLRLLVGKGYASIWDLCTKNEFKNNGFATFLINFIKKECNIFKLKLALEVSNDTTKSLISFYEKINFYLAGLCYGFNNICSYVMFCRNLT